MSNNDDSTIRLANIGEVAGGLGVIYAAAVRRLAADGLSQRQVADRLGTSSPYVERLLRRRVEREVVRLVGEGRSPSEIAQAVGVPAARVRAILARLDAELAQAAAHLEQVTREEAGR